MSSHRNDASQDKNSGNNEADSAALALTMLPRLQGVLRGLFSGPHTQYASACLAASAPVDTNSRDAAFWNSGTHLQRNTVNGPQPYVVRHVIVVVSCTQIFVCDDHAYVHRTIHLERLLAVYVRPVDHPKLGDKQQQQRDGSPDSKAANKAGGRGAASPGSAAAASASSSSSAEQELEVLLVIDGEHDLLLQGKMTCDGIPPKSFVQLLQVLHENIKPVAPLVVHSNNPAPLSEIARLRVPSSYRAPLPIREETHDQCPCWREGDVVNMSQQEFEKRVANIFTVYCPERLPEVKDVCRRFSRRMGGALQHLVDKYGPEPTPEQASAVAAVLARESVNQALFNAPSARQPNYAAVVASQRSVDNGGQGPKEMPVDPLYFPALVLMQRPSGGLPRVTLHISPAPAVPAGVSLFAPYIRSGYLDGCRPAAAAGSSRSDSPAVMTPQGSNSFGGGSVAASGVGAGHQRSSSEQPHQQQQQQPAQAREREFWYLCNEGYALCFDISNDALRPFGFAHGDRVMATVGSTSGKFSIVVGVRDGTLWVHDDGALGATALVGFRNHEDLERLNGWMLVETVKLHELRFMDVVTDGGFVETLDISPEALFPAVGYYHGEVVVSKRACSQPTNEAVILGLSRGGELYVQWLLTSDDQVAALRAANNHSSGGGLLGSGGSSGGAGGGASSRNIAGGGKPLLAVDTDNSAAMPNVFLRKKLPQRDSGDVARSAVCLGKYASHEEIIQVHGWIPVACRPVAAAPAVKKAGAAPVLM